MVDNRVPQTRMEEFLRETEVRLRKQSHVLVDLGKRAAIHSGDFSRALCEITEAAGRALAVERVSVWLYNEARTHIRCVELFELSSNRHSLGQELEVEHYPAYFSALESERAITAADAAHDPRTEAFAEGYLSPLGITSLVDAPIRRLGQIAGVVCHEHVGASRSWSLDEETFAGAIADLVVTALDASERRETREILSHRLAYEKLISSISSYFVNLSSDEIDNGIVDCLGAICLFIGADRAYLVQLSDDQGTASMTHEWCAEGVPSRIERFRSVPATMLPYLRERLSALEVFALRSADDLPPHATAERDIYFDSRNKTVIAIPMVLKKSLIGFVGVNSVRDDIPLSDENIALLRIASEIFVGALQREKTEHALRSSEERHRLLFERNVAGVYRSTLTGTIVECNDALAWMLGRSGREEMLRAQASDLYFSPEERGHFLEQLRIRGSLPDFELRLRRRDGTPLWVLESVHLVEVDGEEMIEGTVVDITDRKVTEDALRESESRYRLMAENTTDLISRSSARGKILYVSPSVLPLLGYQPAELPGHPVLELVQAEDQEHVRHFTRAVQRSGSATFTWRAVRRDGSTVWMETTSRAVRSTEGGEIEEFVSVSRDITDRKRADAQIEYQAYHDALTSLPNRLLFRDRLTIALAHAKRLGLPLAVMFVDLDSFKFVNDTFGHSFGDELLKEVATRIRSALREEDTIARMGGDEFTILLSNLPSQSAAGTVAQKLLEVLSEPVRVEGHELFITASIGIAIFPNDGDTAELLLKNADNAMYKAKEGGRNAYQLCTPLMNTRALERLSTENSLRRAIDREEFVLHYQPQINLDTRKVVGMEALLRWNRPDYGLVQPEMFIPLAEETRLILPIGEWALREACRQAREWPDLRMAVNLSPRQFQQTDLLRRVAAAVESAGIDPSMLEVEITESTAMLNTDRTMATLSALREMGVRIAIDDFGTGHSALNYLRTFAIDAVKIDQSFVSGIATSGSDRAIVSAVIQLARGLGLRVTAEGVETDEQLRFLLEQRCEEVQGFLFGHPLPPTQHNLVTDAIRNLTAGDSA